MAAAMQQMGAGVTDVQTLCGFMDLPTSASCHHHIRQAEAVGGPIQLSLQGKSEKEALLEEIDKTEEKEGKKHIRALFLVRCTVSSQSSRVVLVNNCYYFILCLYLL